MSSHVGVSGGNEGSTHVEQLLRPALPGRKAHRKTRQYEDEGRHPRRWEKRGRPRKSGSIENVGHGSGEGGSTENLSSSGSEQMESAEGSVMNKTRLRHPQAARRCSPPSHTSTRTRSPIPSLHQKASSSVMSTVRPPGRSGGDPLSVDVRRAGGSSRTLTNEGEESQLDEEEEEGGGGVMDVMVPERRMSRRDRKRIKCVKRRQRRKERWRQSQLQGSTASVSSSSSSSSSSSDEDQEDVTKEGYVCAVCLDVYFSPYMCQPCKHIFCEPCLRTLAKNCPTSTPCPLCRTIITHVFFQKELNQMARTFFPKEYACRKQNFQKASCAKWPLPSCTKLFRIFRGFTRPSSPGARRQLPRAGGGFRLNALDYDDDAHGWHFDMDMVIIYIYSVNWIVGFFIFCILCYLFFPSF